MTAGWLGHVHGRCQVTRVIRVGSINTAYIIAIRQPRRDSA